MWYHYYYGSILAFLFKGWYVNLLKFNDRLVPRNAFMCAKINILGNLAKNIPFFSGFVFGHEPWSK